MDSQDTPATGSRRLGAPATDDSIGLYVHIPFCETKCPYCDFNTYAGIEALVPKYVSALCSELTRWGELLHSPRIGTVFFGGGTPSYLPAADIARIVATYHTAFDVVAGAEVTLEANPGDVTYEKVEAWLSSGFNRVSIGVQSFDDGLLKLLGRRHDAAQAIQALNTARSAGVSNISLDLMFGLPRQTLAQWRATLESAISLDTQHLSAYGLQLEPGTPLEASVRDREIPEPDDDLAADMYVLAEGLLAQAGYVQYEISNWAKPGFQSHHNLAYWHCGPYLGTGPGAHSSLFGLRFWNMKSPRGYIAAVVKKPVAPPSSAPGKASLASSSAGRDGTLSGEAGRGCVRHMKDFGPVDSIEETTPALAIAETLMMGLRLNEGLADEDFIARHRVPLNTIFSQEIDELSSAGLLHYTNGRITLTPRGRLLGNEVFGRFVATAEKLDLSTK